MWLDVMVQPDSCFSMVKVTFVLMLSGFRFAPPSCAESAIEKHAACAAASNSSGFVPGPFSNREINEYCVSFSAPPGAEIVPFPSFSPPFHTALALRSIALSSIIARKIYFPHIVDGDHPACQVDHGRTTIRSIKIRATQIETASRTAHLP